MQPNAQNIIFYYLYYFVIIYNQTMYLNTYRGISCFPLSKNSKGKHKKCKF